MKRYLIGLMLVSTSLAVIAQDKKLAEKPKMQFMGAYDAGQPGVNIYKMFDPTEDVVCYIMTPETVTRKEVQAGKWVYEGNNIGSISCLKVKLPVVPLAPATPAR